MGPREILDGIGALLRLSWSARALVLLLGVAMLWKLSDGPAVADQGVVLNPLMRK